MSKICQITGKKAITGNNVSHSKRRTKRRFNVNLFTKKFYWVEQGMWISLTISAAGLRTINKLGLNAAMIQAAEKGYLTENDIKIIGFEKHKRRWQRKQKVIACRLSSNAPNTRQAVCPAHHDISLPKTARTQPRDLSLRNTTPSLSV